MATDYYDESYQADMWVPGPYEYLADLISDVFSIPTGSKLIDLGCGRGYLTLALVGRGYGAVGFEFSRRMYLSIPEHERSNFHLVETIDQVDFDSVALVTSFEAFEHLPMSILVHNLAVLREKLRGYLFLTIPSSGWDRTLSPLGFAEQSDDRLTAMSDNTVCRHLVFEADGSVSGGHITLAGWRWWEDFFLNQGFARDDEKEGALQDYIPGLIEDNQRFCFYVLRKLEMHEIAFGRGWFASEGAFRWNGANSEFAFCSELERFVIELELRLPDPNIMLDATFFYFIEQVCLDNDYQMVPHVVSSGRLDLNGKGQSRSISLDVDCASLQVKPGPAPVRDGAIKPFAAFRARIFTPLWRPATYESTSDDRSLGYQFFNVSVRAN